MKKFIVKAPGILSGLVVECDEDINFFAPGNKNTYLSRIKLRKIVKTCKYVEENLPQELDDMEFDIEGLWIEDGHLVPYTPVEESFEAALGKFVRRHTTELKEYTINLTEYTDRIHVSVVDNDTANVVFSQYKLKISWGTVSYLVQRLEVNNDFDSFLSALKETE